MFQDAGGSSHGASGDKPADRSSLGASHQNVLRGICAARGHVLRFLPGFTVLKSIQDWDCNIGVPFD